VERSGRGLAVMEVRTVGNAQNYKDDDGDSCGSCAKFYSISFHEK
jgi:hypothetical protein